MRLARWVIVLGLFAPLMMLLPSGAAAQGQGDAICTEAIASAQSGTGAYAGYQLVFGSGGSGSQVVIGTEGNDVLEGGSGDDVLCGLGGDDVLRGGSGNDILVGGPGNDRLEGGSSNDTLYGTEGERLDGGSGANQVMVIATPDPSVVITVGPVEGNLCPTTITLVDGRPGEPVTIIGTLSSQQQFRPTLRVGGETVRTVFLDPGESIVSVTATVNGTGAAVPVTFPTTACGA